MPSVTTAQVFEAITGLTVKVAEHLAAHSEECRKMDAMYKILVTGNGQPPLPETVRKHDEWIAEQKDRVKKTAEIGRATIMLIVGQVITLAGSAVAIWLGLKK
jgi:hypothetical protein